MLKLVHAHWTLPVLFRHVPNVPESHYRQIHVTPSMNVRQIVDIVTREMGLRPPEGQAATGSYIFMQIKVNEDDIEGNFPSDHAKKILPLSSSSLIDIY